jgi:hypothetical protein
MIIRRLFGMKKELIGIFVCLLFFGVSISSAISIDNKSINSNNKSEKDCGCEEVSDSDFIKLENYINKIQAIGNLLSALSRFNPEISNKCDVLLDNLRASTELYKNLKPDSSFDERPLCVMLLYIGIFLYILIAIILLIVNSVPDDTLTYRVLMLIMSIPFFSIYSLIGIGMYLFIDVFKCV